MINKIIAIILLVILSFSTTFAYTQTELNVKKATYKKIIKNKIASKLENISKEKLEKIKKLIDNYIVKYKNNKIISDSKKLQKISILTAFKEIIEEKLEDDFSDINNILDTVNKKYGPIFAISDKRCGEKCLTTPIITQLKNVKGLENANFVELDFSSKQAKNLLKTTGITKLPAIIFPNNNVDSGLKTFLLKTNSKNYYLNVGATFNPYEKRSKKGFRIIDKKIIEKIKNFSYFKGNKNSKILYLEYSDMECPFCAKLHNAGTLTDLEKKYSTKLSYSLQHFPLSFHKNAFIAAKALECTAKQKGSKSFFKLEHIIFKNKNSNLEFIIKEAVKLGANKNILEKCIKDNDFKEKINTQQKLGQNIFGITGTPGSVLINTETGEYEVISGAYPTSEFIKIIDRLLK